MSHSDDLRQAGLKTTLPRLRVLSILESSTVRHLSAEDIYRELLREDGGTGLATVYRVLTQFVDAGLVIRHNFEVDRAVFELNDEDHHDHMVCMDCNRVIEFMDPVIEELQEKVADEHGFAIQDHALTLYGLCRRCRA